MDTSLRTTNPHSTVSGGATHNATTCRKYYRTICSVPPKLTVKNTQHYPNRISKHLPDPKHIAVSGHLYFKQNDTFVFQQIAKYAILEQHTLVISSSVGDGEEGHRIIIVILPHLASLRHLSPMIILSVPIRQCPGVVVTILGCRP